MNTRRTLVGFVYREHTSRGTNKSSVKEKETRLQAWPEARKEVWRGKEEAFLL